MKREWATGIYGSRGFLSMPRFDLVKIICCAALFFIWMPGVSSAQLYPTRPINLLISVAPGGTRDVATRILASKLEKSLGQPFVITNNGGGAGTVAMGIVAKEKPDGYHLVGCSSVNSQLRGHKEVSRRGL